MRNRGSCILHKEAYRESMDIGGFNGVPFFQLGGKHPDN